MLGHIRIGAGGQPDVVGVTRQAGVDLGAVDHVLVTVTHGPRGERGQVGARVRLGVADTEVDLSGQDLGEEELLLLLRAEVHDGRAHRVDRQHRHRSAAAHRLVEEDELFNGRTALPTPFGGPADAEPAVAGHLLDHLAHRGADTARVRELFLELRGQKILVVGTQLALESLLLLGQGNFHQVPPGWRGCIRPRQRHVVASRAIRARRVRTRYSPPRSTGQWGRRALRYRRVTCNPPRAGSPGTDRVPNRNPRSYHHA